MQSGNQPSPSTAQPYKYNPLPVLLGVTHERQLTFSPHTENVAERAIGKTRMLAALSHSEWGWKRDTLKCIYLSSIRSIFDYAAPGWQPWLSKSNINILERTQNKSLRLISGQYVASPTGSLNLETGVPTYSTIIKQRCIMAQEKGLRLEDEHPRHLAFKHTVPHRTKGHHSSRSLAASITSQLDADITNRKPLITFPSTPPWSQQCELSIFASVPGIKSRFDEQLSKRTAAISRIRDLASDYTIYTDGSASKGRLDGGAAVVITIGDAEAPIVVDTLRERGRALTCSYEEEACAMILATNWIAEHCTQSTTILICTDSKSLCEKLLGNSLEVTDLRQQILNTPGIITIQWVPGHSDILVTSLLTLRRKKPLCYHQPREPSHTHQRAPTSDIRLLMVPSATHGPTERMQAKPRNRKTASPPERIKFFWRVYALVN